MRLICEFDHDPSLEDLVDYLSEDFTERLNRRDMKYDPPHVTPELFFVVRSEEEFGLFHCGNDGITSLDRFEEFAHEMGHVVQERVGLHRVCSCAVMIEGVGAYASKDEVEDVRQQLEDDPDEGLGILSICASRKNTRHEMSIVPILNENGYARAHGAIAEDLIEESDRPILSLNQSFSLGWTATA